MKGRDLHEELVRELGRQGAFPPVGYASSYEVNWKEAIQLALLTLLQRNSGVQSQVSSLSSLIYQQRDELREALSRHTPEKPSVKSSDSISGGQEQT